MLLALALGCGLIASIGISQVLEKSSRPAATEVQTVCVAIQDIPQGEPVTEAMVALQDWPKDKVPPGVLTRLEDLVDRRPRTMIFQGEPLLDTKLLAKGELSDPIRGVPSGMRLKTISVDARTSAAGLISPGNRVDVQVFARRNESEGIAAPFTKIFLQNVLVYAVDQATDHVAGDKGERSEAKTVSLVVTPEQANRITLAENLGQISLIPRNPGDDAIVADADQNLDDLLNPGAGRPAEQPPAGESLETRLTSMLQALAAARAQANKAAQPEPGSGRFKMTIVYPDEVEQIEFLNGEPIRRSETLASSQDAEPSRVLAPPSRGGGAPPAEEAPAGPPSPGESAPPSADFPIDLN